MMITTHCPFDARLVDDNRPNGQILQTKKHGIHFVCSSDGNEQIERVWLVAMSWFNGSGIRAMCRLSRCDGMDWQHHISRPNIKIRWLQIRFLARSHDDGWLISSLDPKLLCHAPDKMYKTASSKTTTIIVCEQDHGRAVSGPTMKSTIRHHGNVPGIEC